MEIYTCSISSIRASIHSGDLGARELFREKRNVPLKSCMLFIVLMSEFIFRSTLQRMKIVVLENHHHHASRYYGTSTWQIQQDGCTHYKTRDKNAPMNFMHEPSHPISEAQLGRGACWWADDRFVLGICVWQLADYPESVLILFFYA